ncbi:MAG: MFS transporter [Oscillospiraceae bacterium]|nr:MFS transporter [Oscillospiraceae bacterium]
MEKSEFLKQNALFRIILLFCFFASSIGDTFNAVFIRHMLMESEMQSNFMLSLPVTVCSGMMAVGVFLSGKILKQTKQFTKYLRFSVLVLLIGHILKGVAISYWILLAGFGVSGFGTGLIFIGIRYYAFLFEDEKQRMKALVYVNSGAFVGQCLAIILGGILAGQISYQYIYLFSIAFLFVIFFMLNHVEIQGTVTMAKYSDVLIVLKNKRAVLFLLCILIPVYISSVFISYVFQLDVEDYGYSSTVTSVLMLANALLSAYAGPFFTDLVLTKMSALKSTFIYSLMTAVMILLYMIFPSMGMLAIAVIVCGILDSFGLTVIMDAFSKTKGNYTYSDKSNSREEYIEFLNYLKPTILAATSVDEKKTKDYSSTFWELKEFPDKAQP